MHMGINFALWPCEKLVFYFILKTLADIGTYASVFVSRATGGDTGLHLAVTMGSLRAAQARKMFVCRELSRAVFLQG